MVGAIPNEEARWRRRHNYYLNCMRDVDRNIAAVLADPRFDAIRPHSAYALHNMPGLAFGTVALKSGPVNCASRGMKR